ncbi:hypothetical protein Hanom_Chr07g00675761 [Helianthus anomalus]
MSGRASLVPPVGLPEVSRSFWIVLLMWTPSVLTRWCGLCHVSREIGTIPLQLLSLDVVIC